MNHENFTIFQPSGLFLKKKKQKTKENKGKTELVKLLLLVKINLENSNLVVKSSEQDDFYKTFWSTIKLRPYKFPP